MREQLREALDQVCLVPTRECAQKEVTILLGAIGLELYAAYSKLIQQEVEFRHAPEYLEKGLQQDVEETMEINREIFENMGQKFQSRIQNLLKFREKDSAFCEPVSALLKQFAVEVKGLAECRLGNHADQSVCEYLEHMRDMIEALKEYLGLCIGSTSIWEKGDATVSEICGI